MLVIQNKLGDFSMIMMIEFCLIQILKQNIITFAPKID